MLKRITNLMALLSVVLMFTMQQAQAALEIEISGAGAQQIPVAILPVKESAGVSLVQNLHEIVAADLKRSGLFKILATSGLPNLPSQAQDVQYSMWSALQAQAMTVGQIEKMPDGKLKVRVQLLDVLKQRQVMGMQYDINPKDIRLTAHKVADEIYEQLTGQPGDFSSRIAYINKLGKRYTLKVADSDGYNPQNVVSSNEPLISPAWSPDATKMAYVSFENKKPVVYVQSLSTGARKKVANYKGNNSAPAWSPDGKKLAVVLTYGANSQIYTISADGGSLKKVTSSRSIDTEPAFSPDGQWIYFSSDRGGRPQIYKVPANGGPVSRVTFEGSYNVAPDFSRDGKHLTYIRNDGGRFKVAAQDLNTGQVQLLSQGSQDESPSFSPNGRVILYATKVRGKGALATVSADGSVRQRLTASSGDIREPAWAPIAR